MRTLKEVAEITEKAINEIKDINNANYKQIFKICDKYSISVNHIFRVLGRKNFKKTHKNFVK